MDAKHSHRRHNACVLRVGAAIALACCIVLMQWVGSLHSYVHPQHLATHSVERSVGPSNAGPALQALFSGHDSDSGDCRLLDLLMHADLLASVTSAPIAFAPPQNRAVVHIGSHHAAQPAGYLARGPPERA
jgi:hypothetical protein